MPSAPEVARASLVPAIQSSPTAPPHKAVFKGRVLSPTRECGGHHTSSMCQEWTHSKLVDNSSRLGCTVPKRGHLWCLQSPQTAAMMPDPVRYCPCVFLGVLDQASGGGVNQPRTEKAPRGARRHRASPLVCYILTAAYLCQGRWGARGRAKRQKRPAQQLNSPPEKGGWLVG